MVAFLKRNLLPLFLAGSLGLNITLVIILIAQPDPGERIRRYYEERGWRGDQYRRADWDQRREAMADSSRRETPPFTEEQVDARRELRREMFSEIEPAREEINTLQRMMREELRSEEPDIARLDSMTARSMRYQNQIQQRTLRLEPVLLQQFGPAQDEPGLHARPSFVRVSRDLIMASGKRTETSPLTVTASALSDIFPQLLASSVVAALRLPEVSLAVVI